ncbi:MAG: ADP-ribosylglycohydrolase family protein [Archangiaceae bacterium]|nr:ADP-ribosylglycohydrolase family protein [Archangiaceae bacterium]
MPPPPRRPPPPPKKKRGAPKDPTSDQVAMRGRGALLGLSVGDAFGATFEGKRMTAPMFPELCGGVYTEIVGKGPFNLRPGQVTDETQLATALAMSLKELARYDLDEVAKAYQQWVPHAFDIDAETKAALALLIEGRSGEFTGRRLWMDSRPRPAGNNSLGRTAPIGVFFYKDQTRRIDASLVDSAITHFDPRCQLACVVMNAVISAAINTTAEKATHADLLKQVEADLSIAAAQLGRTYPELVVQIGDAAEWLREDVRLAQEADPQLYGPDVHMVHQAGYVRTALRLGLWELFHAPDFEQALIDVINRGGDTDTNGAVAGAMYGAWVGEMAIPQRWSDTVLQALAEQPGPLANQYHPKNLLELAGAPVDGSARPAAPPPSSWTNMGMIKG